MKKECELPHESLTIRCPRLGQQIDFSYCRQENGGLPCFKALDCWYGHFEVEAYFRNELSTEEWERVFEKKPKSKMLSLVELIEEAKRRKEEGL